MTTYRVFAVLAYVDDMDSELHSWNGVIDVEGRDDRTTPMPQDIERVARNTWQTELDTDWPELERGISQEYQLIAHHTLA
jgi:hypothetical protein